MKRKISLYALLLTILISIFLAEGQQAKKLPQVGYLSAASAPSEVSIGAFREGLRELGYVEGWVKRDE